MKTTIKLVGLRNEILFEHICENNTIEDTLIAAVDNDVDLDGIKLNDIELNDIDISRCNLCYADFSNSILNNVNMFACNFNGANFENAKLHKCNMVQTNISNANLTNTVFDDVLLLGSKFYNTLLDYTTIKKRDIQWKRM